VVIGSRTYRLHLGLGNVFVLERINYAASRFPLNADRYALQTTGPISLRKEFARNSFRLQAVKHLGWPLFFPSAPTRTVPALAAGGGQRSAGGGWQRNFQFREARVAA
jgi:hypothetical protein